MSKIDQDYSPPRRKVLSLKGVFKSALLVIGLSFMALDPPSVSTKTTEKSGPDERVVTPPPTQESFPPASQPAQPSTAPS